MNVGHLNVTRPEWYDRALSFANQAYANTLGPHGGTTRWQYTVPTGKKAIVYGAITKTIVATARTAGALCQAQIGTNNAGSVGKLALSDNRRAAVGDSDAMSFAGLIVMNAGDIIIASTSDAAAAGTVDYYLYGTIGEFTAL